MNQVTSTSTTNPVTGVITTFTVVQQNEVHSWRNVDHKLIGLAVLALILIVAGLYLFRQPVKPQVEKPLKKK